MSFRKHPSTAMAALACTVLVSCSHADSTKPTTVALVAAATTSGYAAYQDEAMKGLRACAAALGPRVDIRSSQASDDPEGAAILLGTEGTDAIFAVGEPLREAVARAAGRFDNSHFTLIDARVAAPNVQSILFNERDGGELAGAAAALASATHKIAFIGGGNDEHESAYASGFRAGAMTVVPQTRVTVIPLHSYADATAAKNVAQRLRSAGNDAFFSAAGTADSGVIEALHEGRNALIVTDRPQLAYPNIASGTLTKDVAGAVQAACEASVSQKAPVGTRTNGIGSAGMIFTMSPALQTRLGAEGRARLHAFSETLVRRENASADR